jgi:hypothetical protein
MKLPSIELGFFWLAIIRLIIGMGSDFIALLPDD